MSVVINAPIYTYISDSIITVDGETFEAVPATSCIGCYFDKGDKCTQPTVSDSDNVAYCSAGFRPDRQDVNWKLKIIKYSN